MSFAISLIAALFYSVSSALLSRALGDRPSRVAQLSTALPTGGSREYPPGGPELLSEERKAGQSADGRQRMALTLATVALVLHGWVVIHQSGMPHGLSLPLFTSFSATTLTIVLLHIILCLREPAYYLGLVVYPLAAIALIASQAADGGDEIIGSAVQIHVFLSLVSYAMLALAAAQAILVSIQRHYLSRHKPGGYIRALPPLDITERLLFTLLAAGFVLLSMSLASGFFFLEDMFAQALVHKTVLSCIAWAIFGILLFGRWKFGWRGRMAVRWTLGGFAVLILAYFGTKVVLEVILR